MSASPEMGPGGLERDKAAKPVLTLREISADDRKGLDAVTELHMELLDYGPMAGLGGDFVREVCYRAHMHEGVLRVALAEVDGVPAGFVATTAYSLSFHRSGLRKHAVLAGWETLKAIARDPRRLIKLVRALRVLGSRRSEQERDDAVAEGEVVCIAVRPHYLNPKFQRTTGVRLSETLVRRAAHYLRRAGISRMRMLVDADNKPVLLLYHLLGAHFKDYTLGGTPTVEVVFDLADGRLAAPAALPAVWEDEGADVWDRISDDQEVFRAEARDHVERLRRLLSPGGGARVLDFACGFGFAAELLAPHVGSLAIWDASGSVRRRARMRVAHLPNVEFVDLSAPDESLPEEPFDLISVHSALQHMPEDKIVRWLPRWRRMLKPGGRLVLSDLTPPGTSAFRERLESLRFATKNGFFLDALFGGPKDPRTPITCVTPEKLEQWSRAAGFKVQWLPENTSYRRLRRAAVLSATGP